MDFFYPEEPLISNGIADLIISTLFFTIFGALIYRKFTFDDLVLLWNYVSRRNYTEPEVEDVYPDPARRIAGTENVDAPNSQVNAPNGMSSTSVRSAELAQLAPPLQVIFDSTPTNMNERFESITKLVFRTSSPIVNKMQRVNYLRKNKADKSEMDDCVECVVMFLEGLLKEESFSHLHTELAKTMHFISSTWMRLSINWQGSKFERSVRKGVKYRRWGSTPNFKYYGREDG